MITADRLKAFLDYLALISAKHGLAIDTESDEEVFDVEEIDGLAGYAVQIDGGISQLCVIAPSAKAGYASNPHLIVSIDVEQATAHQRIALERTLARTRSALETFSPVDPACSTLGPDLLCETRGADAVTAQTARTCNTTDPRNFVAPGNA